ncbi:TIGR04282 family arsenosugar biosynthesis glycosyltransferase [Acidiphilium sp. PA]|uniref:TIGR04282 family arsenosugar biosynthesis glycosyltransferase n=1 Tax=Acidiphilium sp. PA TaxID=2871705 RepID=UPI002244EC22|nr:TIGR04282 family arsenosugar biosynthesis glycosyltransferase [Acidiphilium sp. PA]MCW8306757.1 TIGR04282 family arsenosugar biosynthesis glycosyltransferase [Acidiphilium sp. PA]
MSRPVIVLFTRIPRLGVGKRRLAATRGERAALRLARAMLDRTMRVLRSMRTIERVIAVEPAHHARLPARGFTIVGQSRGDLGARMQALFRHYQRRPVLIIGSDIPTLTADDLRTACRRLRGADAVFGPATDGGYWLIGLAGKRPDPIFPDVRWSTPHALADTKRTFATRRTCTLREHADLDT